MLSNLIRAFFPQAHQASKSLPQGAKTIDASQLKQVAGGAPRGGWLASEGEVQMRAPRGGW